MSWYGISFTRGKVPRTRSSRAGEDLAVTNVCAWERVREGTDCPQGSSRGPVGVPLPSELFLETTSGARRRTGRPRHGSCPSTMRPGRRGRRSEVCASGVDTREAMTHVVAGALVRTALTRCVSTPRWDGPTPPWSLPGV